MLEQAVRWPIDPDDIKLRRSDRVMTRLPGLLARAAPRFIAEPAGSRLRRWIIDRAMLTGFAATDSGDWDYLSNLYESDVQLRIEPDATVPGFPAISEGYESLKALMQEAVSLFREFDSVPAEIIDLGGPHFAARVEHGYKATYSGLEGSGGYVYMYEISERGRCSRQWWAKDLTGAAAFYGERLEEIEAAERA